MRSFSTSSGVSTFPSGRALPSLSSWSTSAGLGISFLSSSSISEDLDLDLDAATNKATASTTPTTWKVEKIKTENSRKSKLF